MSGSTNILPFRRTARPDPLVAEFIGFVRADATIADQADVLAFALNEIAATGHANADAYAFRTAIMWVLEQPRATIEKLVAIQQLAALGKADNMSLRKFLGWE